MWASMPGPHRGAGAGQSLAFGDPHPDQLATPREQLAQGLALGVAERPQRWPHGLREVRQDGRVEGVGLGQPAGRAGEVARLARVDHHDRQRRRGPAPATLAAAARRATPQLI